MTRMKLICKAINLTKEIEVNDIFDSIKPAKEIVALALSQGAKDPRVRIIELPYSDTWLIITKKDIAKKVYGAQELTDFEIETLKLINKAYNEYGIEDSDYYNVFGVKDLSRKGAIGSLVRKQVISKSNCPGCFNPMYPNHNYISTCEKYGITVSESTKEYC